jgi:hypothetical protein
MAEACRTALARIASGGFLLVFATRATEPELRRIGGIAWQEALPIPGSEQALLLTAIRNELEKEPPSIQVADSTGDQSGD